MLEVFFTLVLALILCEGCTRNVHPKHLKEVEELCKDKSGWSEINPFLTITARCVDGTKISLKSDD